MFRTIKWPALSYMIQVGGTVDTDAMICSKTTRVSHCMSDALEREELLSEQDANRYSMDYDPTEMNSSLTRT